MTWGKDALSLENRERLLSIASPVALLLVWQLMSWAVAVCGFGMCRHNATPSRHTLVGQNPEQVVPAYLEIVWQKHPE